MDLIHDTIERLATVADNSWYITIHGEIRRIENGVPTCPLCALANNINPVNELHVNARAAMRVILAEPSLSDEQEASALRIAGAADTDIVSLAPLRKRMMEILRPSY